MPPAASTAAVLAALQRQERLLVALAKTQVAWLDDTPQSDNAVALAEQLESLAQGLVNTREFAAAAADEDGGADDADEDEEGEDDEEGGGDEDGEEGGEDGEGGGVAAKLDEFKDLLGRSCSQHEEFYNIKPTSTCGVCRKRNGSYGCFSCNVRICWDPACLRDHLTLGKGNTARESQPMVRKDREPASGSRKNHFTEEEEPAPAPAPARKRRKSR